MNFVLHFQLAARDLGSPIAGVGAMLPDLWRMADRRVRAKRDVVIPADEGVARALLEGVRHHLEADRWFHAAPVFVDGERLAATLLREAALEAPRAGLFAHILWELCLDGALLRRAGFASVLGRLGEGISSISATALSAAVDRHHFGVVTRGPEARPAFELRMTRILAEVARGPWIEGYQHGVGVAERLQGVRRAVGLAPMETRDLDRLASIAEALLEAARDALPAIDAARFGPSTAELEGNYPLARC